LALNQKNPETTLALIEELVARGGLEIALGSRSEAEFLLLVDFVMSKIGDYRYQATLV
jgi:hypothetical protein